MNLPPLLELDSPRDYRRHYERNYQRGKIITADGIRVYFAPQKFGHAFYENSQQQRGPKDIFSPVRAQRMDWIKFSLENAKPENIFEGWVKVKNVYEPTRRVTVVYDDFVVVADLSINMKGELKGNFVTCYVADRSIDRIRSGPLWDRERCVNALSKN